MWEAASHPFPLVQVRNLVMTSHSLAKYFTHINIVHFEMKYLQLRFTPSHSLSLALNALLPLFFLLPQSYTLYSVYFISLPTSVFPPMSQFPKANALEQIIIHTLHPASILASQTTSLSSMCAQWTCIDAGGAKTKSHIQRTVINEDTYAANKLS